MTASCRADSTPAASAATIVYNDSGRNPAADRFGGSRPRAARIPVLTQEDRQREASRASGARSERATRSEPRERSGAQGAPASERVRGLGTKSPDQSRKRASNAKRG